MTYAYTPTHLDGVSLTAAPFTKVWFMAANGPGVTRTVKPVEAAVVQRGDRDVRAQPTGSYWDIHIELDGTTQAKQKSMLETFSEERDLVYLRANDDDAVSWRVACRVVNIHQAGAPHYWIARLRVPDPRWETNTLDSETTSAMAAPSGNDTITNAGNRKALPTITITPAAAKNGTANWLYVIRGFVVNRSPYALVNWPVQLFARSDGGDQYDTATEIAASRMDVSGDDLEVWWEGERIERWLDSINTANTKLWVNASLPPRLIYTLRTAMGNGITPADGEDLEVLEDISEAPESGYLVIEDELVSYQSKDLKARSFKTVERAPFDLPGVAAHTTDKPVFARSIATYIIGWGKTIPLNDAPEASIERRPAIQLAASVPNTFYWGDEGNDANTVFYDPDHPNRSVMFRPEYEVPEADENNAVALQYDATDGDRANWDAADAAPDKPAVHRLTLPIPVGIEAVANAITYDCQQRREMRMRVLGKDAGGTEVEIADHFDIAEALLAAQQQTPTATLHELILQAVRGSVAAHGSTQTGLTWYELDAVGEEVMVRVILEQDSFLEGVALYLDDYDTPAFGFGVTILDDSGGATPETGRVVWTANTVDGVVAGVNIDHAYVSDVGWHYFQSGSGAIRYPLVLSAGTYWIRCSILTWASGELRVYLNRYDSHHGLTRENIDAASWESDGGLLHRLVHDHGGPVQQEMGKFNISGAGYFDKLILMLNDAAADNYVPKMWRYAAKQTVYYHCNAVITNDRNSKSLTLDAWIRNGEDLVIDCEERTVSWTHGYAAGRLDGAVTPADDSEWFSLEPGENVVTYTESGMTNTGMTIEHRGKKV